MIENFEFQKNQSSHQEFGEKGRLKEALEKNFGLGQGKRKLRFD